MSGIVGVVHTDGSNVPKDVVWRMVRTVRQRAADRRSGWAEGSVGLGVAHFHTTPEAPYEEGPLESGPFVVVADARVDNRDELLRRLEEPLAALNLRRAQRPTTDLDLLLAAYAEWGEACVEHIIGDFAFAVWDRRSRTLFCARDPFGVRPLYIHVGSDRVLMATEPRGIFAAGVDAEIDEDTVEEILESGAAQSPDQTIFRGVRLVPNGHLVVVGREGVKEQSYYELKPSSERVPGTDGAVAERFEELFREAVRCRIRGGARAGAQLSGGLDSSAVACVARDVVKARGEAPLDTFTLAFTATPEVDERVFAGAVLETGGFEPHVINADTLGPLANLRDVYGSVDDGPAVGTQHFVWALCKAAGEKGVRVLLDGIDGDLVVEHGQNRLHELARAADWETFFYEARLLVERHQGVERLHSFESDFGGTPGSIFSGYGLPALDEVAENGPIWRYVRSLLGAVKHGGARPSVVLPRVWRRLLVPGPLIRRMRRAPVMHRTVREDQLVALQSPKLARGLALAAHAGAAHGVEVAHPFLDVRLVEYCLSLPSSQSLQNGWTRSVLRRALADTLPPLVRDRVGKTSMNPAYNRGLLELDRRLLAEVVRHVEMKGILSLSDPYERWTSAYDSGEAVSGREVAMLGARASMVLWLNALRAPAEREAG